MKGVRFMVKNQESKFLKADEVASIMETSKASGYRIIKKLNAELKAQGKIVSAGKILRRFFEERVCL